MLLCCLNPIFVSIKPSITPNPFFSIISQRTTKNARWTQIKFINLYFHAEAKQKEQINSRQIRILRTIDERSVALTINTHYLYHSEGKSIWCIKVPLPVKQAIGHTLFLAAQRRNTVERS
jgi:hypothetical protein